MIDLRELVIHRESLKQMSKEQIEELNTQRGWFSNNLEMFKDFNTLSRCWYDGSDSSRIGLRSYLTHSDYEYFLPCKNLQILLEKKCSD